MRRLPLVSFGALVVATVGAFFVTQHLKVSTPLLAGFPKPVPSAINPYGGVTCNGVNHSRMRISFYLLHRSDTVAVYVVDSDGNIVRTLASGRHMTIKKRSEFTWNGREDNGSVAPDGTYYLRVALIHQGRTVEITNTAGDLEPITIKTVPPRPEVTSVSPSLIPLGKTPVTIHYRGTEGRAATVVLYRTDLPGDPIVKQFKAGVRQASWNGLIHEQPAPPGTYLVGLRVADAACNVGKFPELMPPVPGSTPHAGVTVRYLAAEPPMVPVAAGSTATVYVDSRGLPYRWTLWRVGARKPYSHGSQRGYTLRVKLPPAQGAGLYELVLVAGAHKTIVPLAASYPGSHAPPHVLVVLPALTWQGFNPVDDVGDGLPNTLPGGGPIRLYRPLGDGLPAGFGDITGLVSDLDRAGLPYDLTTDLALIQGRGPTLAGHTGVVLAGDERWIPASLAASLRSFVESGGKLVSLGIDSMLRGVHVTAVSASNPTAPVRVDPLGGKPATLVNHNTDLITVIQDRLNIFSTTSGAFTGYSSLQPIQVAPPGKLLSAAGITNSITPIVGYSLAKGWVVDVGLVGFGSSLPHNVDARELVAQLWKELRR